MKKYSSILLAIIYIIFPVTIFAQTSTGKQLVFHTIVVDDMGKILPWYSSDLGIAYDHTITLVWNFWKNLPPLSNGIPKSYQHRIMENDGAIGGDQLAMALSSWHLLYQYSGDQAVKDDMIRIANFYLDYGLSNSTSKWPNIPFPANDSGVNAVSSGFFNGDLMKGKDITQPDKAGSFGAELITVYKMTGTQKFLNAAIAIANTLSSNVKSGNNNASPLPYRVNVNTGVIIDAYTSNWTGTLRLFDDLISMNQGNVTSYTTARQTISTWLKQYPLTTHKWGPFFEDVGNYSDTQINAETLAQYILEHPSWDTNWKIDAKNILDYDESFYGNPDWNGINWGNYGVLPINEQTAYMEPGNSHTARHGAVELLYIEKSGDSSRKDGAIRKLNWATYMVDTDGTNKYPTDAVWLTDGYGDYVRHYLRAMASAPELAPSNQTHILRSSSVIPQVQYSTKNMSYTTFDDASTEIIKISYTPISITVDGRSLPSRNDLVTEGWVYDSGSHLLTINHQTGKNIVVSGSTTTTPTLTEKRGDANNDGKVNGADYVIWLNHYGLTNAQGQSSGDFNNDAKVNGADYIIWLTNYST